MRTARAGFALSAATFALLLALPAHAADVERGHQLAKQWCTSCHLIDKSGTGTTIDTAPSFVTVAADPKRSDEQRLNAWLSTAHPTMPNFSLARNDSADLVAYIRTLAPR